MFHSSVRHLALVLTCLATLASLPTQAQLPAGTWQYQWGDDFAGDQIDRTKWLTGEPGWSNSSQSLASPDGSLVSVGGGNLTLTAIRDYNGGVWDKQFRGGSVTTYPYGSYGLQTSLFTQGSFIEARIKLPSKPGSWPALWGLDPSAPSGLQYGSELDITEYPLNIAGGSGYANDEYHTAFHYNSYGGAGGGKVDTNTNLSDGNYRIFSASWVGQEIRWYINGNQVRSFNSSNVNQMDQMYLLLNYAVGGNPDTWIGRPSLAEWGVGETDQTMVDWLRVWKIASAKTSDWSTTGAGTSSAAAC